MEDAARAVGVSVQTIFCAFGNNDGLLVAMLAPPANFTAFANVKSSDLVIRALAKNIAHLDFKSRAEENA